MYEFIYFLQCKKKAASARKPRACAASAQRELRARSASRKGEARAHLLPHPGRARLPQPLGCNLPLLLSRCCSGYSHAAAAAAAADLLPLLLAKGAAQSAAT